MRNLKWPIMDNQEFPVHNGAFETFVSSSTEKDITVYKIENWLFVVLGSLKKWQLKNFFRRKKGNFQK